MRRAGALLALLGGIGIGLAAGARAEEPELPAPGTVIDAGNVKRYAGLLSEGALRWIRDGAWFGQKGRVTLRVAPTRPAPLPLRFLAASERHVGDVRLRQDGVLEGWAAGLPFPRPAEPDLAAKIMWNQYYRWRGDDYVLDTYRTTQTDRFGNHRETRGVFKLLTVAGRTDREEPTALPDDRRRLRTASMIVFTYPQAGRYQTTLFYRYLDPTRDDDVYVYLPSTRRVLRVQGGQRCTPVRGSDLAPDDFFGFDGRVFEQHWRVVSEGKVLALVHQRHVPPQLDPAVGAWPQDEEFELRDAWLVEGTPKDDGYCYGPRRMWIDQENFNVLWADVYDRAGVYWKGFLSGYAHYEVGNGEAGPVWGGTAAWDFQGEHLTYVAPGPSEWGLGYEVSPGTLRLPEFTPEALLRIGR